MGSKIRVVLNFVYGYQNLSGEKYKTNEKTRAQSGLPVKRKIQKTPKNTFFQKRDISGGILDFSLKW